ncbi:hypothetical protein [uncultured phage]|nr:hypothetical protein [uncultured phage]CAD8327885.1 hypothetical protein [uncultured phage]
MEQKTALQMLIKKIDLHLEKHKKHTKKIDATALIIKNHAIKLMEYEREITCGFAIDYADQNETALNYFDKTFKK